MKRLLIAYITIIIFSLLAGLNYSFGAENLSKQHGLRVKTIYLDPWYGGKELGPQVTNETFGKNITLEIAQEIKGALESKGFTVYLSRSTDNFVPVEERTALSKLKRADIYVVVKVSRSKKDCTRIYTAALLTKKNPVSINTSNNTANELDKILAPLVADNKLAESLALANAITNQLKEDAHSDCIQLTKKFEYVLLSTDMPTVLVDFSFLPSAKKPPYIIEATFQKNIVDSLVHAIKAYANDREPTVDNK
jgi:N-acetylmuramoyl-L-alanine amidase